jgi:hypothetical protein
VTLSAAITSSALTNGGLITYTNTGTTNLTLTAAEFGNAATYPVQSTAAVFTLPPKGTVTLQLTSTLASNWRIVSFEYPGLQAGAIAFSVSKTTAQTVPANSEQVVTFDVADINPQNYFDTVTSRYTPEIAGYYNFSATLTVSTVTITASVAIYKNGTQMCRGTCGQSESSATGTITDVIYMNGTTDYVDVRCTTGGGSGPIFTGQTFFSGSLVTQQNIVNTTSGVYNVPIAADSTVPALLAAVTPTAITDVVNNLYIITNTASTNVTLTANTFIGYQAYPSQATVTSIVMTPGSTLELQTVTIGTGYQIVILNTPINVGSVGFSAWMTSGVNINSSNISSPTVLRYQTTQFNPQNYYNPSTGRFQPLTAGYYSVNASYFAFTTPDKWMQIGIRKNGAAPFVGFGEGTTPNGNVLNPQVKCLVYMNGTSDYLEVVGATETGNTTTNTSYGGGAQFSAFLTNQTLTEVVGTTAAGSATKNAAQAIANGVFTKVTLPGPATDPQSWWNAANNQWIPTIPGYYEVSGMLSYFSLTANTLYEIHILKNGFTVINGLYPSNISSAPFLTGTANTVVYMNGTTDYLEMYTYQSSGAAQSIEGNLTRTNLTLSLVGANQAVPAVEETVAAYNIGTASGSTPYAQVQLDNIIIYWKGSASLCMKTVSGASVIQGVSTFINDNGASGCQNLTGTGSSAPVTLTTTERVMFSSSTMGMKEITFRDTTFNRSYVAKCILQNSYTNSQIFLNRIG